MLGAAAIGKHGVISDRPVLDVNLILQWFWDNIKESREDVEKKAAKSSIAPQDRATD
jgi:hypothetical protein